MMRVFLYLYLFFVGGNKIRKLAQFSVVLLFIIDVNFLHLLAEIVQFLVDNFVRT